jgi:hypothetical protein
MANGNGASRHDAVLLSELMKIVDDCSGRALDEVRGKEDAHINWDYVSKQLATAQNKLQAASVMATMRALVEGE